MRIIHEQTKVNPVLADKAFIEVNVALKRNLTWLDQAFGRAWKITSEATTGKKMSLPCIYTSGNNYEQLVPSADLGNYSFFILQDPSSIDKYDIVTFDASLIVWVDLRKCMATDQFNRRDTEIVKAQIMRVLQKDNGLKDGGALTLRRVYESIENVWKEYKLDDGHARFMEHPYAAFRFDMTMSVQSPCNIIM